MESEKALFNKMLKYKKLLDDIFYGKTFLFKSLPKFIYQIRREGHIDIPYNIVECYYENQAIVQIFKPDINDTHIRVPIITTKPFNRVYLDTMFLTLNKSVLGFINVMDLFSKFAFSKLFLLPKKTSAIGSNKAVLTFNNFLEKIGNKNIGSVITDTGPEFLGEFKQDLINKKIQHDYAEGGDKSKTSPIERFNKTLRGMIEKYRLVYGKITQENLDTIIDSYNDSLHDTLKYSPNFILENIDAQREVYKMYNEKKKTFIKIKPLEGYVRVKLDQSLFTKFKVIWSKEIYRIDNFENGVYTINGMKGKFKREELQPIQKEFLLKPNIKFDDDMEEEVEEKEPRVIKEIEKRITRSHKQFL